MRSLGFALMLGLTACAPDEPLPVQTLADLPEPVSNNAVAAVEIDGQRMLFSLLGLRAGRGWRDTSSSVFRLRLDQGVWRRLQDVPGGSGRLAATAAALRGQVYLFGGYTVAEDGTERSVASVHALEPASGAYTSLAPMPIPVDDTVSLAYADRYIFLVSGWHDTDNVDLVQVYDAEANHWIEATPYPGEPVFGHSGGIVGDQLVICDGVRVVGGEPGRRSFAISDACFTGRIDAADPAVIDWRPVPPHPGAARYRMASTGTWHNGGEVVFAGGSANPYNYDGIGYDGEPSAPQAGVFAWSFIEHRWKEYGALAVATMDHRGLVEMGGRFHIVGGMRAGQRVSDDVISFALPGE